MRIQLAAGSRIARVATAAALCTTLVLAAPPVAASCAVRPGPAAALATSEIVFVGTVTAVENMARTASVTVEEIWRGPDLPPGVTIHGGPDQPDTASSVDRSFEVGVRYLFVPEGGVPAGGAIGFQDNACSATQVWDDGLGGLRPSSAHPPGLAPTATGVDLGGVAGIALVVLLVTAALLFVGVLARGRQET